MKCSLCGNDAAKEVHCVLCAEALAAGQKAERERCARLAEYYTLSDELAEKIRDRGNHRKG